MSSLAHERPSWGASMLFDDVSCTLYILTALSFQDQALPKPISHKAAHRGEKRSQLARRVASEAAMSMGRIRRANSVRIHLELSSGSFEPTWPSYVCLAYAPRPCTCANGLLIQLAT
jgi:hypothetical protein